MVPKCGAVDVADGDDDDPGRRADKDLQER